MKTIRWWARAILLRPDIHNHPLVLNAEQRVSTDSFNLDFANDLLSHAKEEFHLCDECLSRLQEKSNGLLALLLSSVGLIITFKAKDDMPWSGLIVLVFAAMYLLTQRGPQFRPLPPNLMEWQRGSLLCREPYQWLQWQAASYHCAAVSSMVAGNVTALNLRLTIAFAIVGFLLVAYGQ